MNKKIKDFVVNFFTYVLYIQVLSNTTIIYQLRLEKEESGIDNG